MSHTYTATYTRIEAGHMGLKDALHEMALAYQQQNRELPPGNSLIEQVSVELSHVS